MLTKMASDEKHKLLHADASRAYFYAPAVRPVYVQLPEEDREEGDGNMCGRLRVSMYGTRDEATNWAAEYAETLKKEENKQGRVSPCLFHHDQHDVTIMVHGDDFVAVGKEEYVAEAEKALKSKYKIKTEVLGLGKDDVKEVKILNEAIRIGEDGLKLEAGPLTEITISHSVSIRVIGWRNRCRNRERILRVLLCSQDL